VTAALQVSAALEAIRAEIHSQGATVASLALEAGMAPVHLERLLSGMGALHVDQLYAIAAALGLKGSELLQRAADGA
jgi:transcriptional regulator with XRE-family HTH domain